jgi:hypothetical protein
MNPTLLIVGAFAICACSSELGEATKAKTSQVTAESATSSAEAWLLTGTDDERFARVGRQLRGLDVAMVEIGYRYGELYWAGYDRNWGYARYQIDKIRTALKNGVERRPKRAASAQMLEPALAGVEQATKAQDTRLFTDGFVILTTTCNTCHQAEGTPFVHVVPPTVRASPTGPLSTGGSD